MILVAIHRIIKNIIFYNFFVFFKNIDIFVDGAQAVGDKCIS